MIAQVVIYLSLLYVVHLFALSRKRRPDLLPAPDGLQFVFVIPCLNEEAVIGGTLDSLLALSGNSKVLVVDDGSDDRTAEIVESRDPQRVRVLRRQLPNARKGKGHALNAAIRYLRASDLLAGLDPSDVVVSVFDADGRLDPNALTAVASYFRDPRAGAVQIGVEMRNASTNLLARMQDMEFSVFTEIFQRARQRLGSVGLGGNGQFVRLSALNSLGEEPWSDCLTEDLDLGIRLLLGGWGNYYCPTATVDQQAVTSVRRWLRQRARWFQGHMQCWKLLPRIVRSDIPAKSMADLVWYLTLPIAVMIAPFVGLPVLIAMVLATAAAPATVGHALVGTYGLTLVGMYVLCFGQSYLSAYVYWMRGRVSFPRALLLAHAFEAYSHLWLISGWWAVWNAARRRRGWDKTARVAEATT